MIAIGQATARDVYHAFARAELDSSRFGHRYGFTQEDVELIRTGEVNEARLRGLLWMRAPLLDNLPKDITWRRVRLEAADAERLRYMNEPGGSAWVLRLSGGSRRVVDGAPHVGARSIDPATDAALAGIENSVLAANAMEDLIAVEGDGGGLIIVEGTARATIYARLGRVAGVTMLVGSSPQMRAWPFY